MSTLQHKRQGFGTKKSLSGRGGDKPVTYPRHIMRHGLTPLQHEMVVSKRWHLRGMILIKRRLK